MRGPVEPPSAEVGDALLAHPMPRPPLWHGISTLITALVVAAMLVWFYPDFRYLLAGIGSPTVLGDAVTLDPASLKGNTYVSLEGAPLLSHAVEFQADAAWLGRSENPHKVFPLAGQPRILVQWDRPPGFEPTQSMGSRSTIHVLPGVFHGHLVRLDGLNSFYRGLSGAMNGWFGASMPRAGYDKIWDFYRTRMRYDVPEDAFLLIDGERPASKWWAALVYGLILLVTAVNVQKLRRFWKGWRG